jgi:hypothetical protein
MARLTTGQKAQRVTAFLYAISRLYAARTLAAYGFSQRDLDLGWQLLRAVVGDRLNIGPHAGDPDQALLRVLDAWENKWLVIAEATLEFAFPDLAEQVFLNLIRTEGSEVLVSVGTFVERLGALEGSERGRAALALLAERGLGPATIAEAQALLDRAATMAVTAPAPETTPDPELLAKSEAEMWSWYLQWSRIARTVITDRNVLMRLGFGRTRPSAGTGASDDAADDAGDGAGDGADEPGGGPSPI